MTDTPRVDGSDPGAVAEYLVREGLRDSRVLEGERGLRFFAGFGLTVGNQAAVLDSVRERLSGAPPKAS